MFNESKGKTELRLPGEVLKFSTRGFSWKGIVCGSIIARSLAPQVPPQHFCVTVIKIIQKFALKMPASGHQLSKRSEAISPGAP